MLPIVRVISVPVPQFRVVFYIPPNFLQIVRSSDYMFVIIPLPNNQVWIFGNPADLFGAFGFK